MKTSFDRDFNWLYNAYPLWNWQALEGSAFIDKGQDDAYASATYGGYDLGGSARTVGKATDIGAYEFQVVPADRILRVKPDGDDSKNGSDWGNALKVYRLPLTNWRTEAKVEKYGWQPVLTSLQFI